MVLWWHETFDISKSIKVKKLIFGYVVDYTITDICIKLYGYQQVLVWIIVHHISYWSNQSETYCMYSYSKG